MRAYAKPIPDGQGCHLYLGDEIEPARWWDWRYGAEGDVQRGWLEATTMAADLNAGGARRERALRTLGR